MRAVYIFGSALATLLVSGSAGAGDWEIGIATGWAAPAGSAERGARTSDTTVGLVPLDLDVAYRFTPRIGVAASLRYAAAIPTLCAAADDCVSSLGHDTAVSLRARFY